jgi:hypothetical protein
MAAVNVSVLPGRPSSPWSPQDHVSIEGDEDLNWRDLVELICGDAG